SVPGSCNLHGAQLLGRKRSGRGAGPDGSLHEERSVDWKRAFDFVFWRWALEPGCTSSQTVGRSQATSSRVKGGLWADSQVKSQSLPAETAASAWRQQSVSLKKAHGWSSPG